MRHTSRHTHVRRSLATTAPFIVVLLACTFAHAGMGFGPGAFLATNSDDDSAPHVATDGAGHWIVVWSADGMFGSDWDIVCVRSSDNGATWTAPAPVNTNAATDSVGDGYPVIASDKAGHWMVVWSSAGDYSSPTGTDGDLFCAVSGDNGATWTAPAVVNSYATTDFAQDGTADVASNGVGTWVVVWECWGGPGGNDDDPMSARSTNNGATWSPATLVKTNGASDSAEQDTAPRVAGDATGSWIAVWTTSDYTVDPYHSDDDIAFARSTDNGATWSPMAPLNDYAITDTGEDRYCDIETDGIGNWICAWSAWWRDGTPYASDADTVFARSTNAGVTWTPAAALSPSATGDYYTHDYRPSLATSGNGIWLAVWEAGTSFGGSLGSDHDILVARSVNHGATWSTVAAVDSAATSDSAEDTYAALAADTAGHWTAVWEDYPAAGPEYDVEIRYATLDRATDTDHDGVPDLAETNTGVYHDAWDTGSDPADVDSDNDGLPDGWEVPYGLNPNSGTGVNGPSGDLDGDLVSNGDEFAGGSDPSDPASIPPDLSMPAADRGALGATVVAILILSLLLLPRRKQA